MEWNAQDCGISKAAKDTSMLPSKIDPMKVSHETGSEANSGFGRALCLPTLQYYLRRQHFSVFGCSLYEDLTFDYSISLFNCIESH